MLVCTHTPKLAASLTATPLAQHVLRDVLWLVNDPSAKKMRVAAALAFCSREAKAALKSERGSGSLLNQTKASVTPQAALET